nr:hypothetical protein CPGR_04954 [Mycolicibacterium fortuitum subsp. fortuitum DSM 46621 = ATCC 6841 = JCM 6387]CRL79553.1 hypothetical protein CPGR_02747 [Mycolicibacter nonchromogenicus]
MMSSVDPLLAEGGDCRAERYVMQVVANCASDVVRLAGGAIFDRALCGWDVAVYLPTGAAERAISILGARVVDLSALGDDDNPAQPTIVIECVGAISHLAGRWRDRGWWIAQDLPAGLHQDCIPIQLSSAAAVFKGHALAAAGCPGNRAGSTETFLWSTAGPSMSRRSSGSLINCDNEEASDRYERVRR